jgi:DNA repair exonuclease SbcCD ATPase subunit
MGMNYKEFITGAYIFQRGDTSVLSMTPANQIRFIETLAKATTEKYKADVKEKYRELSDQKIALDAEYALLLSQHEGLCDKLSDDDGVAATKPKEYLDASDIRKDVDAKRNEQKKLQTAISDLQKKLDATRTAAKQDRETLEKIKRFEMEIEGIDTNIAALKIEPDSEEGGIHGKMTMEDLESELENYTSTLAYYKRCETYQKDYAAYEEALQEHERVLDEKLDLLKASIMTKETIAELEKNYSKMKEAKRQYDEKKSTHERLTNEKEDARTNLSKLFKVVKSEYPECSAISSPKKMIAELEKIKRKIESAQKTETLRKSKRWVCPCCSSSVVIDEELNELALVPPDESKVEMSGEGGTDISVKKLRALEGHLKSLSKLAEIFDVKIESFELSEPQDPMELYDEITDAKKNAKEYEILSKRELSATLKKTKQRLDKAAEELEDEGSLEEIQEYIEELEEKRRAKALEYDVLKKNQQLLEGYERDRTKKTSQIEKLRSTLSSTEGEDTAKTITNLEKKISTATREMMDINEYLSKKQTVLDDIATYEKYENLLMEKSILEDHICYCAAEIDEVLEYMNGLKGFEETVKEAEILTLEKTIKNINEHAKFYIDQMFLDPPTVQLKCLKDKGKNGLKLGVYTSVEYQGDTYDDFSELSGGESARIEVAYLLGVNDMLGGSMILLDEAPHGLEPELNQKILELIESICGHKTVLTVFHDAIDGVFNEQVEITSSRVKFENEYVEKKKLKR